MARHPLAVFPAGCVDGRDHLDPASLAADTSTVTTTPSIAIQRAVAWSRPRIATDGLLAGLVAGSALIRSLVAVAHVAPGYFPTSTSTRRLALAHDPAAATWRGRALPGIARAAARRPVLGSSRSWPPTT